MLTRRADPAPRGRRAHGGGRERPRTIEHGGRSLGRVEFTGFLAMTMALAALGIDLMLPAFAAIRSDLGLPPGSTAVAGLVTAYFLGLAVGTVVHGPVSDRYGRRRTLFVSFAIYAVGAVLAALAWNLALLLVARFVWGFGAAGPRVITLAVVRDTFDGERMSRAMSLIMAVFIVVPVIAPTLGAGVVALVSWRWLFVGCALAVAGMSLWARRLPETLPDEHRLELSFSRLTRAAHYVLGNRRTVGYMLALTVLYGAFISYIASSENIFALTFGAGDRFPLLFGLLAGVMGSAMLLNARIVGRLGVRRLAHGVLLGYLAAAAALVAVAASTGGRPPLALFLVLMAVLLAGHALLIPNLNTIAMQPMAAVAGTAAAVIGATQVAVGALLGAGLDRTFDGSILPLSVGFLGYGLVAALLVAWAERWVLFQPLARPTDHVALAPPVIPPAEGVADPGDRTGTPWLHSQRADQGSRTTARR